VCELLEKQIHLYPKIVNAEICGGEWGMPGRCQGSGVRGQD